MWSIILDCDGTQSVCSVTGALDLLHHLVIRRCLYQERRRSSQNVMLLQKYASRGLGPFESCELEYDYEVWAALLASKVIDE